METVPNHCQESALFDWDFLSLKTDSPVEQTVSVEEFGSLNIFDFAEFESPMSIDENFLNVQNEISYEDMLTDLVDIDKIIKENASISDELERKQVVKAKPVKRLNAQKDRNKEAVIKYRSKKIKKREELFAECEDYAKKNSALRQKIDDVLTEISLIKTLLVEALIAKKS